MLLNYRYRFLCGQGLLGVIFLAGSGIDAFYAGVSALLKERVRPIYMTALPALIVYLLTLFSPSARRDVKTISFDISGSTFMNLLSPRRAYGRFEEVQLYKKKFIDGLIGAVERETAPDDIIYCNYAYFGGMLSSLSGRSLSCGMLNEVRPPEAFDPARHARLILWVKNPDGIPDARLESLIKELKLEKIAETDIAGVYKNRSADAKRSVAKDAVSCRSAFLILSVWAALVIFTLSLKGPPKAQLRR
jgi:hypothetical protein